MHMSLLYPTILRFYEYGSHDCSVCTAEGRSHDLSSPGNQYYSNFLSLMSPTGILGPLVLEFLVTCVNDNGRMSSSQNSYIVETHDAFLQIRDKPVR